MDTTSPVIDIANLPEQVFRILKTTSVRLNTDHNGVLIIPANEEYPECPIRGITADSGYSSEQYLADKKSEKEFVVG